ncbi:tRNA (adenosine(37)-N6)-threonylcarbamoyltransferase complex ATPase subunit type 1 TsaE, partial [Mangrovimonas sp. AS39]|uniref:tRNA (adenosine(37)-N6)-threonylcarbamoyltransferase complex ATPase subunit type 1 TsaE n=1 Tax=Mangrovimonas futianensis TaxID=2895523 RepID=UPI001E5099C5
YSGTRSIIYALEGQMGAGKTQFVKGLAKAMGINEQVTSPSYDLLNTYNKLVHIDTWRMIDPNDELKELGTKELLTDNSVVAIEWADRAIDEIKKYS